MTGFDMTANYDEARSDTSLLDEVEQLRTALESALEENDRLVEDRDRLLRRVTGLSHELQATPRQFTKVREAEEPQDHAAERRLNQSEEELRVAFEEMQVLTEELEAANSTLHEVNQHLDRRVEERTREVQDINRTLLRTEASLRAIADLVPDLLWRTDAVGDANWFNRRWFSYTGQTEAEAQGRGWIDVVHPVERDAACAAWATTISEGWAYQAELRIGDRKGGYRWFLVRAEPLRDDQGKIIAWFAAGTDIHDQRTMLDALRQSELRFRTLVEGMPQLVWRALDGGQWTWSSPQWASYTGQTGDECRGMGWLDAFHPDDRGDALAAWGNAVENGVLEFEARILHLDEGRYRHFRTRALPVGGDEGAPVEWLGTSTDVDDILQLQQEQAVLVAELQHRTRNLMAVVQSVTTRTLKDSDTLEEFQKCIDDRLQALSRVQGLLSQRDGMRVTFDALLLSELAAQVPLNSVEWAERVSLKGPKGVSLRSAAVQTLALALHELTTNAVKYGAFSTAGGGLEVCWRVGVAEADERPLWIDWRERGVGTVPDDKRPRGSGYGRELIERALPYSLGARTSYTFEPDGVHCTIEVNVPCEDIRLETSNG